MQVLVNLEHRFYRTPDKAIWTATTNSYTFWARYLDVFERVRVLARVEDVQCAQQRWVRADGPQVEFHPVPCFVGPKQYVRSCFAVERAIASSLSGCEAVIMRVPSLISNRLVPKLRGKKHPFSLEVVADPFDVFAPGSVEHPLRSFFRKWFASNLRTQCREARAVSYVTANALQQRYPAAALTMGISDVILPETAFTTSYSSVELSPSQILSSSRTRKPQPGRAALVFVGSLDQLYKAPDILIKATGQAIARGCDLHLRIVGDGRYRRMLQEMAQSLGIEKRCEFLGQLPSGPAVQEVLDHSDIFVLPSRVEALPRAMIEAMARGLPCIGSKVGGIPELIEPECLVEVGDVNGLAQKIEIIAADPERQRLMAVRNIFQAKNYAEDILQKKRIEFYAYTRDFTASWLRSQHNRN